MWAHLHAVHGTDLTDPGDVIDGESVERESVDVAGIDRFRGTIELLKVLVKD